MMKKCTKCETEKEFSEFYNDKTCRDGVSSTCKTCVSEHNKNRVIKLTCQNPECRENFTTNYRRKYCDDCLWGHATQNKILALEGKKKCSKCGETKELNRFHTVSYTHLTLPTKA